MCTEEKYCREQAIRVESMIIQILGAVINIARPINNFVISLSSLGGCSWRGGHIIGPESQGRRAIISGAAVLPHKSVLELRLFKPT